MTSKFYVGVYLGINSPETKLRMKEVLPLWESPMTVTLSLSFLVEESIKGLWDLIELDGVYSEMKRIK